MIADEQLLGVLLELLARVPPREVRVGLREADLRQPRQALGAREGLGEEAAFLCSVRSSITRGAEWSKICRAGHGRSEPRSIRSAASGCPRGDSAAGRQVRLPAIIEKVGERKGQILFVDAQLNLQRLQNLLFGIGGRER